ncbi:MAG: enoyl-CoA hydratase-related protein [Burkholderiaceae bacterium]
MTYEQITVSHADNVCTITLSRPDRLNAYTPKMADELQQAMQACVGDGRTRAIVLTGAGRGFCAGADMQALGSISSSGQSSDATAPAAPADQHGLEANYRHKFGYLLRLPLPVFAAINGPVAGIGLCLTLFCDYRYMAAGAKLTTAFAQRGLIAEHGISWMLPRLIGNMNALDLLFSARKIDSAEAARMGLVRELPAEDFLPAVQRLAAELAATASPRSIGVIKRQVYDAWLQSLDEAWVTADEQMKASFTTEDFREGVAHYLEKRPPRFTGR